MIDSAHSPHVIAAATKMANAISQAIAAAIAEGITPATAVRVALCAVTDNARCNFGEECLGALAEIVRRSDERELPPTLPAMKVPGAQLQ